MSLNESFKDFRRRVEEADGSEILRVRTILFQLRNHVHVSRIPFDEDVGQPETGVDLPHTGRRRSAVFRTRRLSGLKLHCPFSDLFLRDGLGFGSDWKR